MVAKNHGARRVPAELGKGRPGLLNGVAEVSCSGLSREATVWIFPER